MDNKMVNRIRLKVLSYIKESTLLNQDKGVEIWDLEWNKGESSIDFEQSHSGLTIVLHEKIDRVATKTDGKKEKIRVFKRVQDWQIEVKPDEWFVVRINDVDDESYYKCDQWDGLMKLFKDVLEPQIESMSQCPNNSPSFLSLSFIKNSDV
jgi:hypothetical protein